MFIFQVIAFFFQTLFLLFIAGIFIFNPWIFFMGKPGSKLYNTIYNYKINKWDNLFARISGAIIGILIIIYTLPYLLDLPVLIKGNFSYVTGYVYDIKQERKNIHDYVYINEEVLKFFFSSNVEKNNKYKIGYLPHTSRAVCGEKIEGSTSKVIEKITFPFKDIFYVDKNIFTAILLYMLSYRKIGEF